MKSKSPITICAIALVLMSLGLTVRPLGQAGAEAHLIHLRLTAPGGKPIRACVVAGGMVRITNHKAGTEFAYFPTVLDEKNGIVSVKVYKIDRADGSERLEEVEAVEVSFKAAKSTVNSPTYNIAVETISRSASKGIAKIRPVGFTSLQEVGGQCCVTCGEITVCSNCTVTMSCGSCCTGDPRRPACDCGGGV